MRLVLAFLLITRVAFADDKLELYHCERKPTKVAVSFKPETDLKELLSWTRGLVEEIDRSIGSVQDEAAARAQLSQPTPVQIGPVPSSN